MTDIFRKAYRPLTESEQELVEQIKDEATRLYMRLEQIYKIADLNFGQLGRQRHASLAKTKLEECVMWATKAVTG